MTSGGSGEPLDTASGLILTNGGESVTTRHQRRRDRRRPVQFDHQRRVGLSAEINATSNGINVRSLLSGADFTIGENGGTTATQLGIRTYNGFDAAGRFQSRRRRPDQRTVEDGSHSDHSTDL